jgi:hypothetical protein
MPASLLARWPAVTAALLAVAAALPAKASGTRAVTDTTQRDSSAAAREAPDSTPTATPHRSAGRFERLTVHGYLTQGYAALAGGVQFYGVTGHPSADFRYAALQTRFALGEKDELLVQLNHRRLGRSPITAFESPVNVDWAFYEHTFRDGTALKAGRVPIPRGIYNELRSVGVALPTYRPPVVFYDEGAYYSETINGVVASRTFAADRPWTVDAHLYAGGWRTLLYDTWSEQYSVARVHARNAIGGQLWLNTPIDGVRLGAAAARYDVNQEVMETSEVKEYHLSLDATRERGFLRAEGQRQNYGLDDFYSGYVQLGARLVRGLHGVVEVQRSREADVEYGEGLPSSYEWHRSNGLGMWYAITPTLVLKVEQHWDRGIQLEQPGNPLDPPRFRYAIASVSVSF